MHRRPGALLDPVGLRIGGHVAWAYAPAEDGNATTASELSELDVVDVGGMRVVAERPRVIEVRFTDGR